jgi:hypothetical protein
LLKAIKHNKKYYEIKEVFESLEERWYWFTLVERPDKDDPSVRYGLVVGFANEFGTFSMRDLEPLIKQGKIWRVPKGIGVATLTLCWLTNLRLANLIR